MLDAAFRSTLDAIATPAFSLVLNEDGEPVFAHLNIAHHAVVGLDSETVLGHTAVAVFGGRRGEMLRERHKRVFETGHANEYNVWLPGKYGERAFRTRLRPVHDASGTIAAVIGTMIETTSALRAETELLIAEADRAAAHCRFGGHMAQAAQDLRLPMRNVASIATMLRDDLRGLADPATLGSTLHLVDMLEATASRSALALSGMIERARAPAAAEIGEDFDFGVLCSDIFAMLDPEAQHRLHHVDTAVRCDKTAMQLMLRKLVDNALTHADKASASVQVTIGQATQDMIRVEVLDDGFGYETISKGLEQEADGAANCGFSLLAIRRLAVNRGGDLRVSKGQGGLGTRVRVDIPGRVLHAGSESPAEYAI